MTVPDRASVVAEAIDLALVLILLAALSWLAVAVLYRIRRPRRRPRSWLRDYRAEARERRDGDQS